MKKKSFYEILDTYLTEIESSEKHYSFEYRDIFDRLKKSKRFCQ